MPDLTGGGVLPKDWTLKKTWSPVTKNSPLVELKWLPPSVIRVMAARSDDVLFPWTSDRKLK